MANKLEIKNFKTLGDLELIVINRKSAIIFEVKEAEEGSYRFEFKFSTEVFNELLQHIEYVAGKSWKDITPKEADSMGADYCEYYDRKLDNNGYLSIKKNLLKIERPSLDTNKLYQFNKKKIESFIYDFKKI